MNIITFVLWGVDKWKAAKGQWRISEKTLLILVSLGGGIGAVLGMQAFRHKTIKGPFLWKVYLSIAVRVAIILTVLIMKI